MLYDSFFSGLFCALYSKFCFFFSFFHCEVDFTTHFKQIFILKFVEKLWSSVKKVQTTLELCFLMNVKIWWLSNIFQFSELPTNFRFTLFQIFNFQLNKRNDTHEQFTLYTIQCTLIKALKSDLVSMVTHLKCTHYLVDPYSHVHSIFIVLLRETVIVSKRVNWVFILFQSDFGSHINTRWMTKTLKIQIFLNSKNNWKRLL